MAEQGTLYLQEGAVVALPFYEQAKFVVGAQLGGGMGSVYQLLPLRAGSPPLALKTYQRPADNAQFEREARIWVAMSSHPAVAKALAYGYFHEHRCILAHWYPQHLGNLDPTHLAGEAVLALVQRLIHGLKVGAEQHGLIHKDLKPSNILLDAANHPHLADFGISSLVPDTASLHTIYPDKWPSQPPIREPNSTVSGTPRYMAPELFHGAKNTLQTDIFALGVTLFEWLTGQHPYITTNGQFNQSGLATLPAFLRQRWSTALDTLARLLSLALNLNPAERPATYVELLERAAFPRAETPAPPKDPPFFTQMDQAQVLLRQGRGEEALLILRRELADHPQDVLLLTAYANTLIRLQRLPEAKQWLQQAVTHGEAQQNRYLGKPYLEPHLNAALLALQDRAFPHAADLLTKAQAGLLPAESILTWEHWEFAWLTLYRGNVEEAKQRLLHYLDHHAAIEPAIALMCLVAYHLPQRGEICRQAFDLIAASPCRDIGTAQFLCVLASALDAERRHRFATRVIPPEISQELARLSAQAYGNANFFTVPMTTAAIQAVLQAITAKYLGDSGYGLSA